MYKIKFNHVQDLTDARFAASAMAEWIGFSTEGPNALEIEKIQEIIGWCSGPKLILEIESLALDKIESYLNVLPVNGIECSASRLEELKIAFPDIMEWIVLSNEVHEGNMISHSSDWGDMHHIVKLDLTVCSSNDITNKKPWGFSLDCEKELEVGRKDLTQWYELFETLDIF